MKGLVYHGPEQLRLEGIPDPRPADGEVLIRVKATGICGSDLHGYLGRTGRRTPPMVMGHEFAGVIEEAGAGVRSFRAGDRVVVQPLIFCGECEFCRRGLTNLCVRKKMFGVMDLNGSMATFVTAPERLLYRLPQKIDFPSAAMVEPLAVGYGAAAKANVKDRDVLIVGAGTIGLLLLQVVLAYHPRTVVVADVNDFRLGLATSLGATAVVNSTTGDPQEVFDVVTQGRGIELSFEAVGISPTVQQALSPLKNEGTCVWVGNSEKMVTLNMQDVVTRPLKIIGSYCYSHEEFGKTLDMLAAGKINLAPLISKCVPLEQGPEMFRTQTKEPGHLIKIILTS
ncbi:MAG: galactitol-1-phosphate 5-dehydrogenase [Spirochaetia bacterium]|jgi:2-desacetyl-2-hydroxyethyl bacteriochlorophyllide A dehydrogenase